jgi:hypothetical protein
VTPAEHIAKAEQLLADAEVEQDGAFPQFVPFKVRLATAHALIALAVENGVPHSPTPPAGVTNAG